MTEPGFLHAIARIAKCRSSPTTVKLYPCAFSIEGMTPEVQALLMRAAADSPRPATAEWRVVFALEALAPFCQTGEWSREIRFAGDWMIARFDVLEGERATLLSAADFKTHTMILGGAGSAESIARATLRRVRDLQHYEAIIAGALPLHAACVEIDEVGVLICGDKFAGKTTTTIDLLTSGASSFVCNDKVLVWSDEGGAWVQGVPRSVAIRPPTLEHFPLVLDDLSPMDGYDDHDEDGPTGRICLTPWALSQSCGVRWSTEAKPGVLLFPEFDPSLDQLHLDELSAADATRRLSRVFLSNYFPHSPEMERIAHARVSLGPFERIAQLQLLARACRAFRVRQGSGTPGELFRALRGPLSESRR